MPIVTFAGVKIECELGANLRRVLMRAKLPLYHPLARVAHCRGMGTCGTCAVKLRGSASWPTKLEALRLRLPPHTSEAGLRLACQCVVHGDLDVEKFGGIWGQDLSNPVGVRKWQDHPLPHPTEEPTRPRPRPAVAAMPFRSGPSQIRELNVAAGHFSGMRRRRIAMPEQRRVNLSRRQQLERHRLWALHS